MSPAVRFIPRSALRKFDPFCLIGHLLGQPVSCQCKPASFSSYSYSCVASRILADFSITPTMKRAITHRPRGLLFLNLLHMDLAWHMCVRAMQDSSRHAIHCPVSTQSSDANRVLGPSPQATHVLASLPLLIFNTIST